MISTKTFVLRAFFFLLLVSAFFLFGYAYDFVLLVFASILFGTLISYGANALSVRLKIKYGICVALVLLMIVALIVLVIWLLGPSLSEQVEEMKETLPKSLQSLKASLKENKVGRMLLNLIPDDPKKVVSSNDAVQRVSGAFSATLNTIAYIAIVLVAGIFLAIEPSIYRHGFIRLFPVYYRDRLDDVLMKCYETLSSWLIAQFIAMAVVGITTGVGLMLLGIPLPWALALIAFLFAFVPNIGPYIALAPAVLISLMEGPDMALYVVILYFGIQIVESYLVTPMIQKKMVSIPPALLILWQVLVGLLAGVGGLLLATPILAAIIVLVKELYIKDKLEKTK